MLSNRVIRVCARACVCVCIKREARETNFCWTQHQLDQICNNNIKNLIIVLLKQRFLELYAYGACISKARVVREAVKATSHHVPLACHCNVIVIAINQHLLVANRHGTWQSVGCWFDHAYKGGRFGEVDRSNFTFLEQTGSYFNGWITSSHVSFWKYVTANQCFSRISCMHVIIFIDLLRHFLKDSWSLLISCQGRFVPSRSD